MAKLRSDSKAVSFSNNREENMWVLGERSPVPCPEGYRSDLSL